MRSKSAIKSDVYIEIVPKDNQLLFGSQKAGVGCRMNSSSTKARGAAPPHTLHRVDLLIGRIPCLSRALCASTHPGPIPAFNKIWHSLPKKWLLFYCAVQAPEGDAVRSSDIRTTFRTIKMWSLMI